MKYWLKLPVWARKLIVAALETGALAVLAYVGDSLNGLHSFSVQAMTLIFLKAIVQFIRVYPGIPVKDYINDQKPQR